MHPVQIIETWDHMFIVGEWNSNFNNIIVSYFRGTARISERGPLFYFPCNTNAFKFKGLFG